jgi:hypothetical protein
MTKVTVLQVRRIIESSQISEWLTKVIGQPLRLFRKLSSNFYFPNFSISLVENPFAKHLFKEGQALW